MVWAQSEGETRYPQMLEYVYVDTEPVPVNLPAVRRQIGYPPQAFVGKVEGKVYARVLVDTEGRFVDSRIIRSAHPVLTQAVEPYLPELRFTPAYRAAKETPYWVNVAIEFDCKTHRHLARLGTYRHPMAVRALPGRTTRARESHAKGMSYLHLGQYRQAMNAFSRAIVLLPRKRERACALRAEAYLQRGRSLVCMGKWPEAFRDMTESVGILQAGRQDTAPELVSEALLDRALAFAQLGEPTRGYADCTEVLMLSQVPEIQYLAYCRRALTHIRLGNADAAFLDIESALALDPARPEAWLYKSVIIHTLSGEDAYARDCLEHAWRLGLAQAPEAQYWGLSASAAH
ncbi:MAG: energy transducer TonB [Bacteroidia bacterium]|nr:energy transducer TonB [Bacteroidia bacterium]